MKIVAMIPARYSASRFPGKLMKDLDLGLNVGEKVTIEPKFFSKYK